MPLVISIVGKSNSGKTTLLEQLIRELKGRGYRVVTMKHAGEVELDKEGKDSWRFSRAGSEAVVVSSKEKLAIFKNNSEDLSPRELAGLIPWSYDIALAEGFKQSDNIKIEVHRQEQGKGLLSPQSQLLAVVTDEPLDVAVPQFARDDIGAIADIIEKYTNAESKRQNSAVGRKS